jgi:hypothetical protein
MGSPGWAFRVNEIPSQLIKNKDKNFLILIAKKLSGLLVNRNF